MNNVILEQVDLPQHARPMAVQARLLALLEGLGVPQDPVWLNRPVSEFQKLGEMFYHKIRGEEPPKEENGNDPDPAPANSANSTDARADNPQ